MQIWPHSPHVFRPDGMRFSTAFLTLGQLCAFEFRVPVADGGIAESLTRLPVGPNRAFWQVTIGAEHKIWQERWLFAKCRFDAGQNHCLFIVVITSFATFQTINMESLKKINACVFNHKQIYIFSGYLVLSLNNTFQTPYPFIELMVRYKHFIYWLIL